MSVQFSTSETQDRLLTQYSCIAAMDEVGRGSIAGPVATGVVVLDRSCGAAPTGLADSKRLSIRMREQLVAPILGWSLASAVGYASASEIDNLGIILALRLAGLRALHLVNRQLLAQEAGSIEFLLLDGKHNWLRAESTLMPSPANDLEHLLGGMEIATQVKADATCQLASAASILAKVARDAWMSRLPDPGYGWKSNKGYASSAHVLGLKRLGVSRHHRRSWKLPGVST